MNIAEFSRLINIKDAVLCLPSIEVKLRLEP